MPLTVQQHSKSLAQPPLCEQLKVRDIIDDLFVELNGSFVAGYTVSGINSYYASDEERNRTKLSLEALVRSLPERSMRMQVRFEITEGTGDLVARYNREQRNPSSVLQALDREQTQTWAKRDFDGYYLRHFLHFYFAWDPRIHHQTPDLECEEEDAEQQLQRLRNEMYRASRREHEDLLASSKPDVRCRGNAAINGMKIARMSGNDLFFEVKRALHPLGSDSVPYRRPKTRPSTKAHVARLPT